MRLANSDGAMDQHRQPPNEVTLVYGVEGKTHVFTAHKLAGFSIGSASRKTAFEQAIIALGEHISLLYGCKAEYLADMTYEEFESHLSDKSRKDADVLLSNFVVAKFTEQRAHV